MKIILAEDHNIVRSGIKIALESDRDIQVVSEFANGKAVLDFLRNGGEADLVLTDINMPEIDGLDLIKLVHEINENVRVVILSMHNNEKYITSAFAEGAYGYLLKSVGLRELIFALKHIYSGAKYVCAEIGVSLIAALAKYRPFNAENQTNLDFSTREMEILSLVTEGLTNTEMADKLFISKRTVESHRQSLLEKTGSKNTAMLIKFAYQNALLI